MNVLGRIIPINSSLLIEARSFVAVTLTIKWQVVTLAGYKSFLETGIFPNSEVVSGDCSLLTNADGSVAIKNPFPQLPNGYLVSLHVFAGSSKLVERGDCFVNISIVRGSVLLAQSTNVWETLLQGYVSNDVYLSYPDKLEPPFQNNKLFRLNVGTPGAGNDLLYTIPDYTRLKFNSIAFTLTTNATVATRRVSLVYNGSGGVYFQLHAFDTQLLSLTRYYVFAPNMVSRVATGLVSTINSECPALELTPGETFEIIVDNIQAGDLLGSLNFWVERSWQSKLTTASPGGGGGKGAS